MDELKRFLKSMPSADRAAFARRCGTTIGYLNKALSIGQTLGESLCINIERESGGVILCEFLRDDVDWAYLRKTCKEAKAAA